jgi:EAL domain-containing protein (putative c-di-GMP-specific phosphodiesterase class I)
MYAAKKQGRNMSMVFYPDIDARDLMLREIGRDLYHALSRGELRLDFQPLICRDSSVAGFEALLRWSHPIHGLISPAEIIPIAERSGLIAAIGEWVLTEACRECRLWQDSPQGPLGVAVNVSSLQLEQPWFPRRVAAILSDIGLAPALLTLELSEGFIFSNLDNVRVQLNALRSLGVRIALDDFGTGFSSLSILVTIPADIIKLDKSFLPHHRTGDTSAIRSVFAMARRIGMRVIAEGVETQAQRDWLNRMDCDELQGYYVSKPIPAAEIGNFLEGVNQNSGSEGAPLLRATESSLSGLTASLAGRLQTAGR